MVNSTKKKSTRSGGHQQFDIPPPENDQYTPREAGEILSRLEKPLHIIEEWINDKKVPVKRTQLYAVAAKFENGIIKDGEHIR